MKNIYEVADSNKRKSAIVIITFFVFFLFSVYIMANAFSSYMGYEVGGFGIAGIALILSGITSFFSYYFSDRIILSISRAHPADRERYFNFYTTAENLAIATGLPKPKLYVIEDSAPNAFATGRDPDHAVICATTGLLNKLDRSELEGVIAHELSHIRHYDIRLLSIVSVLVGSVALLGDWFLRIGFRGGGKRKKSSQIQVFVMILGLIFAILSPIIAQLIQLAISRRREFYADAGSVSITRQPQGLISALTKISEDTEPLEAANKATAHLYIANPFRNNVKNAVGWFSKLFNTHPPMEERLKALREMQ
jgi:heat shock protein HtpX